MLHEWGIVYDSFYIIKINRKMQKKIFSNKLFYLTIVIVVSLVWLGRGYFFDEFPAKGREEFYQNTNRHISDESNLAIAISGLNTPVGENITAYGRKMIDTHYLSANKTLARKDFINNDKLRIIWFDDHQVIDCNQIDVIEFIRDDECISIQDTNELIEKNNLLLNRYYGLYQIPDWEGESYEEDALILRLNALVSAKIKLLINQKNSELAYQEWKNNHLFILHTLKQELPLASQSSFQIVYSVSLKTLEHLIYKSPEILLTHDAELGIMLKPQDLTSNLKHMLRADYGLFNSLLSSVENTKKALRVERIRNRLYYHHLDYLKLAELSANESSRHYNELVSKYKPSSSSRIITFIKYFLPYGATDRFFNVMIMGNMFAFDLITDEMHTNNAMSNLLYLRNQIKIQNVDETNIRTFVKSSSKEHFCPFTEKPMAFDKRNKTLYCKDPKSKERVAEVRLIL